MKKLTFLMFMIGLSFSAVKADAKPVTAQMYNCGGKTVQTISTHCKNQANGFTLRYSLHKQGANGSLLKLYNPTARNIEIDRITLLNSHQQECELDSWGSDGETLYANNHYHIPTSECKPEQLVKFILIVGSNSYTFVKR